MELLLTIVAGFASGVILRSLFVFGWHIMAFGVVLAIIIGAAAYVSPRKAYSLCGVFLMCAVLGAFRTWLADVPPPSTFVADLNSKISYEGIIISDPDVRDAHQRIPVEIIKGDTKVSALVIAERFPEVRIGDRIQVRGVLAFPEPFSASADGRIFRYDKYLQKEGITFLVNFASVEVLARHEGFSLTSVLSDLKYTFTSALEHALPEPNASLAGGLLLGGKQGIGDELKHIFTTAGLVHILVLSGYNVMIVAAFVLRMLAFLPKRFATGIAALTIGLFVLMAGAGAASIRAGAMASLGLFAEATGRTFAALRALLIVGFLMVLWNPLVLVFDPGFQLSFIATAGLILGAPIIALKFKFIKNAFFREIISTTIAAQIAVLPLLLYQTGLFSLVALPANILVLPLVPFAMLAAFVAGLVALIIPPLAVIAGFPAYLLLSSITFLASFAASLPLASYSIPAFPFFVVSIAYVLLGYFVWSKRFSTTDQFKLLKKAST